MAEIATDPIDSSLNKANSQISDTGLSPSGTERELATPKWYFNKASARLNAAKSAQVRKQLAQARQQAIKQASLDPFQTVKIDMGQPQAEHRANPGPDPFVQLSLNKARAQLDKLYKDLDDKSLTPAEKDKLASAIAKFSEIERNLAMRPGPGTVKPAESKSQSRASWLLGEPEPTPSQSGKQEQE